MTKSEFDIERVSAFGIKVDAFAATLTDEEQRWLSNIVLAASSAPEVEIQGYLFTPMGMTGGSLLGGLQMNHVFTPPMDATVNKSKTADKARTAMDAYIRS
jgi:hypothetical protein